MVGMDSWCPSCGYSVDPGTRFCGGCGQQLAAEDGASAAQSSTVTVQSPPAPFPGHAAPACPGSPPRRLRCRRPRPAAPCRGRLRRPGAPAQPPAPGQPGAQPPFSDTLEQMLRPQGLFQHRLPPPVDWQQGYPPAPGAYPPAASTRRAPRTSRAALIRPARRPVPGDGRLPAGRARRSRGRRPRRAVRARPRRPPARPSPATRPAASTPRAARTRAPTATGSTRAGSTGRSSSRPGSSGPASSTARTARRPATARAAGAARQAPVQATADSRWPWGRASSSS